MNFAPKHLFQQSRRSPYARRKSLRAILKNRHPLPHFTVSKTQTRHALRVRPQYRRLPSTRTTSPRLRRTSQAASQPPYQENLGHIYTQPDLPPRLRKALSSVIIIAHYDGCSHDEESHDGRSPSRMTTWGPSYSLRKRIMAALCLFLLLPFPLLLPPPPPLPLPPPPLRKGWIHSSLLDVTVTTAHFPQFRQIAESVFEGTEVLAMPATMFVRL